MAHPEGQPLTPFVGRDDELAHLWRGIERAVAGRGSLHLLVGEPGIGKTRLADELAMRAAAHPITTLWGRCWESGGAPAYWPWVQILRTYVSQLDAPTLAERVRAAPDLLHLLPNLRALAPELPELRPHEAEEDRFRLLDAAGSFLRAAAADRPLLLILDDLHAGDLSSLLLLRFLARDLHSLRIVIVGTFREVEATHDPEINRLLADIVREGERIPIRGLKVDAVASYIAAMAPRLGADATHAVYATTEGNPLFMIEVVRLWAAEQRSAGEGPSAIPEHVRAVIRRRLDPLPAQVRRILAIAAVQGRELDVALMARVAATAPDAVIEALDVARAAGAVEPIGGAIGRFRFTHVLIRDVLYDGLPGVERAALHRAFATEMERMHAVDLAPHLAEIAHHYSQAAADGDVDKAIEFERRAGDRALGMWGYEDAARHFRQGLRALGLRHGDPLHGDRVLRCELLLSLGDALWGAGDLPGMREAYQRAAEAARDLAPGEAAARLARAALGLSGRRFFTPSLRFDSEVVALLEEALTMLGPEDSALRARVLARLAFALYLQPRSAERREGLCAEAEVMARRIGDPETLRWVLNDRRWILWGPESIDERLRVAAELRQLTEPLGDVHMALSEHACRMRDLLELGDVDAFDAEFDACARFARRHPRPWCQWYIHRFEAMCATLHGRFADAERHANEALAVINRTPPEDAYLVYAAQMMNIRTEQGRLGEMEAGLQNVPAQYPGIPIWPYAQAFLSAELGRPDAVRAELKRMPADGAALLPEGDVRLLAGSYLAEACAYADDTARAAPLYELLLPYAAHTVVIGFGYICRGSVARYLGVLASMLGRHDAAAAHFEAALRTDRRLRARPSVARTQLGYAELLLERHRGGDRERSATLLREAHATAVELGMQGLAPRIAAVADRAGLALAVDAPPIEPRAQIPPGVPPVCHLRREGEYWAVGVGEAIIRVRHVRGLTYIVHLLHRPGEDVHVFDLLDLATGSASEPANAGPRDAGDAGEVIDAAGRAAYKARLRELREELADAEAANDLGRIERCRAEIDQLADHLAAATGFGGRTRQAASQVNRARVAVAKAIRTALERIDEQGAEVARHLDLAIKTGTCCSYTPDPLRPVRWDLG